MPRRLMPGDVVTLDVPTATHDTFVTEAWTRDPLPDVLRRIGMPTR